MVLRATSDDLGVMIDRDHDPDKWAAWEAYFHSKNIRQANAMRVRKTTFMVPANWPHDFDADQDEAIDHRAARIAREVRAACAKAIGKSTEERRNVVRKAMAIARAKGPIERPYPPPNFPFGATPRSIGKPTHPPRYNTVYYDEHGNIIPPPLARPEPGQPKPIVPQAKLPQSSDDLKTKAKPPSAELKRLVKDGSEFEA